MAAGLALWKQLVVVALLLAAAGAAWHQRDTILSGLGLNPPPTERRRANAEGVPVIVAQVGMDTDNLVLEAVGTGRAKRSIMLRPEASGKIVEIAKVSGRPNKAGDVLLRLDDTDQQLAVQLAETRLKEALRVRDQVARLQDSGNAAASRFEEARSLAEIAAIDLERAREALTKRVLRAPFDGVAGIGELDEGAWIDTDSEIASFDDRSVILVEFELPEALLARIGPGTTVTATTPAAPGERFEGRVAAIDTRIAASSRTVKVRVTFANREDRLRPGASFIVRLDLPGETYPVVPELAVLFSRGSLLVWRVSDDKAEQVQVRMVRRRDGAILVDGLLSKGDLVVVEGAQRLSPGRTVRILDGPAGGST